MARRRLYVSALAVFVVGCQSTSPDFATPPGGGQRWTLGQLTYEILHSNLERADTCSPELVAAIEADRDRFITTFDYTITNDITAELPDLLGGTILPLVDSGELPALTDAIAAALALLIDHEVDADRKALTALVAVSKARSVLSETQAIELVSRVLADPLVYDRLRALTALLLEDEGRDLVVSSVLDLASRAAAEDATPACGPVDASGLVDRLLATEGFVADPSLGAPAWSARADVHGNPAVRVDPDTGELYPPFVDADGDGAADVDARGRPIDASGAAIDVAAIGDGGSRDHYGRALAPDGTPLYEYFDVKQTFLAHALELGRDALEAGIHRRAIAIADAALGAQVACSDGTATCFHYASEPSPVADAAWMLFEAARYERSATLVRTMARVVRDDPRVAERLLLAVGELMAALEASGIALTDPQLVDVGIDLVPLLADMFATPTTSGESTARLLLDVVHELGRTARDFPAQLAMTVDYTVLVKADACSAAEPNLAASTPVDYDQRRFYTGGGGTIDNRSSLEKSIELLADADCGRVPFTGGKSVAYVLLDLMADRSPSTVCNLVDLFLGTIDVVPGAGRWVTVTALDGIGCDGDAVYDGLRALDDLAKSGALDFYIPVLRVFADRGQIDTVLQLIAYLAADLRKDEDADAASESAIRRLLPVIQQLLDTNAADVLFDLDALMVTVPAADGDGNLADVTIDAVDHVLREDVTVHTRRGDVTGSSIALELLTAMRGIVQRIDARGAGPDVDATIDFARGYLTRTRSVAGEQRLYEENLVPMLAELLDAAGSALERPRDEQLCFIDAQQANADELLTTREIATAMRVGKTFSTSPNGAAAEEWIRGLIAPRPSSPSTETLGLLLQLAAGLLQSDVGGTHLEEILRWLGRVAGQLHEAGPELVRSLDHLLAGDTSQVGLTIARTLVAPGPLDTAEPPMCTFGDVFTGVATVAASDACEPTDGIEYDVADAEEILRSVVDFMNDDATGLGAIYALVGRRSDDASIMSR